LKCPEYNSMIIPQMMAYHIRYLSFKRDIQSASIAVPRSRYNKKTKSRKYPDITFALTSKGADADDPSGERLGVLRAWGTGKDLVLGMMLMELEISWN
jgi:hypothetical protein